MRLFLSRFPNHAYAAKAADLQSVVRTKFKSHAYSIAAIFPMSGKLAPFGTEVLNGIQLALERTKDGGETPSTVEHVLVIRHGLRHRRRSPARRGMAIVGCVGPGSAKPREGIVRSRAGARVYP